MAIRLSNTTFDFKDVMLVPAKCVVNSRSETTTSVNLGGRTFRIPVVPANMSTIIDEGLAQWLASNGYFYVLHRFDIDPVAFVKDFNDKGLFTSISLGIKEADYKHVDNLAAEGLSPDYITVDVAHGHSETVIDVVKYIKANLSETYVIAGNVGSVAGAVDLENAGADCVKVGIGPGCFAPDALVRTEKGLKEIQNIEVEEKVLTHSGKYQKVVDKFRYEHHEEMIEINGIKCTPNHEFYVCDKENLDQITEENYREHCYWVEAHALDTSKQLLVEITE